ncbi:hypothetical protein K9W60_15070, partial [Shigella flexneri]
DGNGSHASTLKSPSYTKSVSWQHYPLPVAYYFRSSWQLQFLYLSGKIHRHKLTLKMWFYIFCHREYVINSS